MKTRADNSNKPAKVAADAWDASHSAGLFIPAQQVQPKLAVGAPGDKLEQEADATAQRVMTEPVAPTLQEEDRIRKKTTTEEEEKVQRQCSDCASPTEEEKKPAETIQRQATAPTGGQSAPPIVGEVVASSGQPMDAGTRGFMENRFGTDFSNVRLHNDAKAQDSARSISAEAYTYRNHIAFASGRYSPHTPSGKELLAHELTHVVQQQGTVRRRMDTTAPAAAPPQAASVAVPPAPSTAADATAAPDAAVEAAPPAEALPQIAVPIEPIMPAPPDALGAAARQRLRNAQGAAQSSATATADVPDADSNTLAARAGVTEPQQEADARASGALAAELGERPAPSPEILELCARIREVIRSQRPPDEDSLLSADPEAAANEAGSQLNDNIEGDVDRVEGEYDNLDESPAGTPEQIGESLPTTPENVATPNIAASGAAPDPLTTDEVSLDADVASAATQMTDAGMDTPAAQAVQDGPIAEARAAHGELAETAAEDPALVLAEQDAALGSARADMETLQARALAALQASRSGSVAQSGTQQTDMVRDEVSQREGIAQAAEDKFTAAQTQVNDLLAPLPESAMTMWDAGKARIATDFENHLARVQRWVDDRHSGFGGGVVELWDDLTGLPGWVTDEYNDAERAFGDDICALIQEISTYVNGVILTCEEIIDTANREIDALFANAGPELAEWAAGERAKFQERLDGLREQVSTTQQDFNRDLAERASQAVQEVRERVHALREAAKGLLGRIADALMEFLEDPLRAIINGLLRLVGIDPAAFWALAARIEQVIADIANDPLGFASHLLSAIGAGFQRFFDNFFSHLFEGFIQWVFSGLGAVGVEIPSDLSLGSIITFFLQLMGITWERVRALLARHIGEENVALLEQAYSIISDLIALGPAGIYELIKDQLNPQQLLNQVIEMAVNFVTETIIAQATIRIIGLFNPVGAIAQAIEAIYRVLRWIFENAARIFTLVETVVNGIADIVAGNIAGMAATVESALKQLLVPVIDFIAGFMGLGNLPERVADMIRGMQNWVEGILDRVIGWLAGQARSLLAALGIGGEEDPEEMQANAEELEDTEIGERISFTANGERHRLWIDSSGQRPVAMMASEAQPVAQVLAQAEQTDSPLADDDAPALIDTAQAGLVALENQALETQQKMNEATDGNQATTEEVEQANTADAATEAQQQQTAQQLTLVLEATETPDVPAPVFSPGFSAAKASILSARNMYLDDQNQKNHPDGSEPSSSHLRIAFAQINALGVAVNASWVRFHLLNAELGGKAANSNLIPMPGYINNPEYLNQFEVPLKNLYKAHRPIWFLGDVQYRDDNDEFVQSYEAIGGALKYENGRWTEDSAHAVPDYRSSYPGLPDPGVLAINDILQGDTELKEMVSKLTPLSKGILEILHAGTPAGGYASKDQLKGVIDASAYSTQYKTTIKRSIDRLSITF